MSNHNHHIVPIYKCIELGLTTSYKVDGREFYFKENCLPTTRLVHADIHWGYYCKDLSTLLEHCNPPQWVIDMIPLGDKRDMWSAKYLARGEIDGIDVDMSGKNSPAYKHGLLVEDSPEVRKKYNKINSKKHSLVSLNWYKDNMSEELMEERRIYAREYIKKNKEKFDARSKEYRNRPETKARLKKYNAERYARKKAETQEVGTLKGFI